jgi:hypothetical protein
MFEKIVCRDIRRKGAAGNSQNREISDRKFSLNNPPAHLSKETGRLSRALWQLPEREVIDEGV